MKIPPKKPHFFKPLQKGFKHGLKIPTGFLKYLKGQDQIEHAVLRKGVKNWLVKVNGGRFEAGWAAFVEEHDLQLGDLLIFRHEGDMEFKVSIFDSSHCNREYAEYLQEEEGSDNVEEISKNFKLKDAGTHNPCDQSHFECTVKPYCISNASNHKPFGQSHFVCIVRRYCLVNDFLVIPTKFELANGLSNKRCDLIIRDERERSWNVKLRSSGNRVCIRGGWDEFRDANFLKKGDCIMFEVVSNGNTPIWKYNGKFWGGCQTSQKTLTKQYEAVGDGKGN
ncbi:hypothetical protein BC332_20681 [Capsicum chinense]|nr:hypothetical protein BC332_20681 [Capsicum chinense]